ncbi:3-hydroxyacyl-CoA dehydrogenase [Alteromonas sp. C1M14]|uniref:3-hydroxyacyl-CoA dehydrogenase n=1 Tax=Alteromonas sp. C1M14 TaxID=2841567 RepID=UPI001C097CF3|nr:3-hydroxyacyl-CoA dehydrogenase [Alteromonas sp. C1M14]MBU2977016.1 3-hydroxyacyl-CoA dehydrogenase [Alteromonas sp. C1M14]
MDPILSTAVITGGASGLGYATARYLLARGVNVALLDISEEQGNQCIVALDSDKARFFKVDVTNEGDVKHALQGAQNTFGQLGLCLNCAGIAPAMRTLDKGGQAAPLDKYRQTIDINLLGTFNVSRLAAEIMAIQSPNNQGERGVIINTASIAGYEGQIGQTAYAASKAGIIGMTLPMARDLAPLGIRVNTVAPGVMGTPLLLAMPQAVQDGLSSNVPFPQRLGLPDEFAALVTHIWKNSYLNGETIRLDGGLRMPPK